MSNSPFKQGDYPTRWIPLGELGVVWTDAQRPVPLERTVRKIVAEFDPDAFGVIVVTEPTSKGIRHIIDGQTRVESLRRMSYGPEQKVPCIVVKSATTKQDAARAFSIINGNQTNPTAVNRFLVDVVAKREPATSIDKVIHACGFRVSAAANGTRSIAAVASLVFVEKRFGLDVLETTLHTISVTWPEDPDATHGSIIKGFGHLIGKCGDAIDFSRFREKVAKRYAPANLVAAARAEGRVLGGSLPSNVLRLVVICYNRGLRDGQIGKDLV